MEHAASGFNSSQQLNYSLHEPRLGLMRPLVHPALQDITVEGILYALSDPARVAIYADILGSSCSQSCSDFINIMEQPLPKSTLSLHLKSLREAGLIRGERRGVEMYNTSRCAEIDSRFPGLIASIVNAYKLQLQVKRSRKATKTHPRRKA